MARRNPGWLMWIFPVLLVAALAFLGWGIYLALALPADRTILAAGCLSFTGVALAWLLAAALRDGQKDLANRLDTLLTPLNERIQIISVLLNQVSEQQLISERAKAIAFRESERDALRRAIREEMARKDWDAAITLINEIETVFGYRQEADRFRTEINHLREAEMRKAVEEAMAVIDRHCRAEQWTEAMREAERVAGLFSADVQAAHLPEDVENRRQAHKKQLLDNWNVAVTQHDVDGAIDILKQLDLYLTPAEAQAMQETARQVFKDKLLMLGQQFTLSVKEHHWAEAIRVGEAIASEFPNSRMAQEVREKMDLLKQRASETEPAKV